jgi:hypothetical protein
LQRECFEDLDPCAARRVEWDDDEVTPLIPGEKVRNIPDDVQVGNCLERVKERRGSVPYHAVDHPTRGA